LSQAPFEIPNLQASYDQHFPVEPLSATRTKLASAGCNKNAVLEDALAKTVDAVDLTLTTMNTVERFV
jgi:hypothetical protein